MRPAGRRTPWLRSLPIYCKHRKTGNRNDNLVTEVQADSVPVSRVAAGNRLDYSSQPLRARIVARLAGIPSARRGESFQGLCSLNLCERRHRQKTIGTSVARKLRTPFFGWAAWPEAVAS
jgi:hypothetical protein